MNKKSMAVMLLLPAFILLLSCQKDPKPQLETDNLIEIDATSPGTVLPNIVSNINLWDMGSTFYRTALEFPEFNVFDFVEYVQLMQCSGGTADRDMYKGEGQYDFTRLIKNCTGILKLGAKPLLKLGSVPLMMTTDYVIGDFGMNMFPPDDYKTYYDYIHALACALVNEFGLEEVRTWRFGCMTEYENIQWFAARSLKPRDSFEAYCKLYDFTAQALVDVLGEDVFIGAHSMTCTEGLWPEEWFIEHVAQGRNWANGGIGSPIKYLASSYYDNSPGHLKNNLPESIKYLQSKAEQYGLTGLIFGVDEGRILAGITSGKSSNELYNRCVGYTWQAAYDARLYKQCFDNSLNYFSNWNYLTAGNLSGYPVISYHVASNIAKFAGARRLPVNVSVSRLDGAEVDCVAASQSDGTIRVMVYNFKNVLNYAVRVKANINIRIQTSKGKVTVTRCLVSDDCNFFDEWIKDRTDLGITNNDFGWSPDDPMIDCSVTLASSSARSKYREQLRSKYVECSRLTPTTEQVDVSNGKVSLGVTLGGSNVVFLEIK